MIIEILTKDPAAILDYTVNWQPYLAGKTIVNDGASLTVPSGITLVDEENSTTAHTFRLSGGTDGLDYEVVSEVVLDNAQVDQRSVLIQVREVQTVSSSDATFRAKALSLLLRKLQRDVVPPLTADNIVSIVNNHKVASVWQPNTFYSIGQRLLPPEPRNGVWYSVIQPGTSQSGTRAFSQWPTQYGSQFSDGSSDPQLVLETQESDWLFRSSLSDPLSVNVYDVGAAALECIDLRLQLASHMIDDMDQSFSQISENLLELRKQFRPIMFPIRMIRC